MKTLLKKLALAVPALALVAGVAYAQVGNDHTGYDSENNASVEAENELDLEIDNDADIFNRIFAKANSGWNEAEKNTGDGEVETGDAAAAVEISNRANATVVDVENCCDGVGGMNVTNSWTGADSENNAWVEWENEVEIDVDNDADVNNCVEVNANTGGNEASKNTGNGSVSTGDASASVTVDNTVNANDITVR